MIIEGEAPLSAGLRIQEETGMSDFESKIYEALHEAVLSLYELDVDETVLVVETPKDTRLGDYATSAAMNTVIRVVTMVSTKVLM